MLFLKVLSESIRQAWSQLTGNKLRTFLSLLGISIGIFCIIGVLSAVDSLEESVSGSLAKLGDDVIYVDKWPWADVSNDWWEIMKRPFPDHEDYEALKEKMPTAAMVAYWTNGGTKKMLYGKKAVEGGGVIAGTYEIKDMLSIEIDKGRYFTRSEYTSGANKLVIGSNLADELFGALNPIRKTVKMGGQKYEIIGVIKKSEGELLNIMDFSDAILVGYPNASRFINFSNRSRSNGQIGVKARPGIALDRVEDDIRGVIRATRTLRPRDEDNFALNQLSMIADALGGIFAALNSVGYLIGGFSIIVGMISVANIMFVSVKERTSLIGVKKALGARRFVILLEFLTESVVLCIIGGIIGLVMVWIGTAIFNAFFESFSIALNSARIVQGIVMSVAVGILAGFIPANQASKMDAVEAMRS